MVNTEIIYKIKQQTGDFILLSQIMDILKIVNKGLGRMKKTFVPAFISQLNFASLIRNISKTPISLMNNSEHQQVIMTSTTMWIKV